MAAKPDLDAFWGVRYFSLSGCKWSARRLFRSPVEAVKTFDDLTKNEDHGTVRLYGPGRPGDDEHLLEVSRITDFKRDALIAGVTV
jgi:hypothetical protein